MKVTRSTVDSYIRGSGRATYESRGNKGVYKKSEGPASTFKSLGKTWREVYISLLIAEGTATADKKLDALGVTR